MMPYKGTYLRLLSALLRRPMIEEYGRKVTDRALKGVKSVYREMLMKVEDIGADNPMAKNIYLCFVFLAIWKAGEGAITAESLRHVSRALMERPTVRMVMGRSDLNRPKDLLALEQRLHRMKDWADAHPEYRDKTWDFNFDETLHRDGVYYHFTRCPLEKFARENGYLEVLPVGCAFDHLTVAANHGVLHRDHTLAEGGCMCDYWIVPDRIKDPK